MLKSKTILTSFLLIFITLVTNGQQWPKIYGDSISTYCEACFEHYDKGYCFLGSIITTGNHFEYGWLFKTDINGNVMWDKKFGDSIEDTFFGDFDETSEHGWIICGSTTMIDEDEDPMYMKLNACGEVEWCKILHSDSYNYADKVLSLPDGNFLGSLYDYEWNGDYQCSLVKMNSAGEPIWIKSIINDNLSYHIESIWELSSMPDSSIIISCFLTNQGQFPFWIKTDLEGNKLWEKMWPEGQGSAGSILLSSSDKYYSCGSYELLGRQYGPTIYKLSQEGEPIDKYFLINDSLYGGGAGDMIFNNDSNITTIAGWSIEDPFPAYEFNLGIWVTDTNGEILNSRQLLEQKNVAVACLDNGYEGKVLAEAMVYGDSNWDVYFWKMNSDLEDDTLSTQVFDYDSLCPYEIVSDTINFNCDGLYVNIVEIPTKEEYESTIKISPNPARTWITLILPDIKFPDEIEISICNLFGQEVMKKEVNQQNRSVSLNISNLSPGLYLLAIKNLEGRVLKGKFEIIR
jgi:hypothetical protein